MTAGTIMTMITVMIITSAADTITATVMTTIMQPARMITGMTITMITTTAAAVMNTATIITTIKRTTTPTGFWTKAVRQAAPLPS